MIRIWRKFKGHTCKVRRLDSQRASICGRKIWSWSKTRYLGIRYTVTGKLNFDVEVDIPGKFSVYNSLTAIAICRHFNVETEMIQKALKAAKVKKGGREGKGIRRFYVDDRLCA